jgi:hypothetical protein
MMGTNTTTSSTSSKALLFFLLLPLIFGYALSELSHINLIGFAFESTITQIQSLSIFMFNGNILAVLIVGLLLTTCLIGILMII